MIRAVDMRGIFLIKSIVTSLASRKIPLSCRDVRQKCNLERAGIHEYLFNFYIEKKNVVRYRC